MKIVGHWKSVFEENSADYVGITVGNLAQGKEQYNELLYMRTKELLQYILSNTEYSVLLIPHVATAENGYGDVELVKQLAEDIYDPRIIAIDENRADEQKYIISKCKMIITVRTHVSIASYSMCVPTIVIGYSIKSSGIAKDLFGTDEIYVISLEEACKQGELINSFQWLDEHSDEIRSHLKEKMTEYISRWEQPQKMLGEV